MIRRPIAPELSELRVIMRCSERDPAACNVPGEAA